MNDELKSKLLEILTAAQKAGGDAYDYVKREAPELAREVVLWRVVECAVALAIGLILLATAAWLTHQIKSKWHSWRCDDVRVLVYPTVLAVALGLGGFVTFYHATALLQAHYAPRVFFLMSCKKLLK